MGEPDHFPWLAVLAVFCASTLLFLLIIFAVKELT
jgi:hypothetical protein